MLQDLKPPMNPKETSLMTHPDASIKMYDISQNKFIILLLALVYDFYVQKKVFKLSTTNKKKFIITNFIIPFY